MTHVSKILYEHQQLKSTTSLVLSPDSTLMGYKASIPVAGRR